MQNPDRVDLQTGHTLFAQGDEADNAYVVESGFIEVHTSGPEGNRVLARLGPGSLVGEIAIVDDEPRSATATALTNCRLAIIRRDQVRERLDDADPTLRWLFSLLLSRYRANLDPLADGAGPNGAPAQFTDRTATDRLRLEAELWAAVENRDLIVYYQPIVKLCDGSLAGYEALLRWNHPERGMIPPSEFIALAEETTHLIEGIGTLVAEKVAMDQAALLAPVPHDRGGFIALNVSPRQTNELAGMERLHQCLASHGADPARLKLEITEGLLAAREPIRQWIAMARDLGYRIAIDDFGTGYSSLSQMLHLQADTLKIDQVFVRDMMGHPRAKAMVTAVVAIAKAFDMTIVAEGIETDDQRRFLCQLGCDYGQGWLFGKPRPFEDHVAAEAS